MAEIDDALARGTGVGLSIEGVPGLDRVYILTGEDGAVAVQAVPEAPSPVAPPAASASASP
jgi:hypothetical protein